MSVAAVTTGGVSDFPPLLQGYHAGGQSPFAAALAAAAEGCDAGLVLYDAGPDVLEVAIVLAPEVALRDAAAMLPVCAVALQNALGALGPAEMAVHLDWFGDVRINGAVAGRFRGAVCGTDPDSVPQWLVIGWHLRFRPEGDGGETPDRTALHAEGAGDLTPEGLLSSWARHLLVGIHRWEDEGVAPVHRDFAGLLHGMGKTMTYEGETGTLLGLDEKLGLLFRTASGTRLIPLTTLLEECR